MPHFVADDGADDRRHFSNGEELRPSRPVALARVACWIQERGDRNAGDIVNRGRGVPALSGDWQRQDPEMRRYGHHLEKWTISEETGSNGVGRYGAQTRKHAADNAQLPPH